VIQSKEEIIAAIRSRSGDRLSARDIDWMASGIWRWKRSTVDHRDPLLTRGPKKIAEDLELTGALIEDAKRTVDELQPLYLFGSGALRLALALAKQYVFEHPVLAHHAQLGDFFQDPHPVVSRNSILILELEPDAPGKVWVEMHTRLLGVFRNHRGPVILVKRQAPRLDGDLYDLCMKHYEPKMKIEVET